MEGVQENKMAERNIGERLLGVVRDIITAPVRSYRAERLR